MALSPVHRWAAQWIGAATLAGAVIGALCSLTRQVWRG